MKQRVFIYNTEILPRTQTFTAAVASSLRRYEPVLVGLGPARNSLPIESEHRLLTQDHRLGARIRRNVYKHTGIAPIFHRSLRALDAKLWRVEFLEGGALAWGLLNALPLPATVTLHGSIECMSDAELQKSGMGCLFIKRRKWLFERVAEFHCVSEFIRKRMIAAGAPTNKLITQYIGVDRRFYAPRRTTRRPVVLFVGRLVEKKGCVHLLEAMRLVQKRLPGVSLEVIGDGPLRAGLEQRASLLSLSATFLGHLDARQIRDRMSGSSVMCVPSVRAEGGDSEGLGMVALEAQAMGLPIVASNHGGLPEAISDGLTGTLVAEKDSQAIADALELYLADVHIWKERSEAGIAWVEERFDLQKQTAKLEERFAQLIAAG